MRIVYLTVGFICLAVLLAGQVPVPPSSDPDAPALTIDEKIALATDDLKRQDALEKANAAFQKIIDPINQHQQATRKVIEDEHPGWILEGSAQGWRMVRKPAESKAPKEKK